jgi:hypothetical protein
VLGSADVLSSLAASISVAAELLKGRIDAAAANGVRWGSYSPLVATMPHFSELKTELEVLGFRRGVDLIEEEQMPSGSERLRPRIRWHHMFLLRLSVTLLTA